MATPTPTLAHLSAVFGQIRSNVSALVTDLTDFAGELASYAAAAGTQTPTEPPKEPPTEEPKPPVTPTPTTPSTPSTPSTSTGGIALVDPGTYATTAALRGDLGAGKTFAGDSQRMDLLSLDASVPSPIDGRPTIRATLPAGDLAAPILGIVLPDLADVWSDDIRRYVPGFTTTGDGTTLGDGGQRVPSGASFKTGPFYLWKNSSGRAGVQLAGTELQGDYEVPGAPPIFPRGGSLTPGEWTDGKWVRTITHWRRERANVGVLSVWRGLYVAGVKVPLLYPRVTMTLPTGATHPLANAWRLSMNYNQFRRAGQVLGFNIARIELIDGGKQADPWGYGAAA